MQLKKLTIALETFGENKGKYVGEIEYTDPVGSMKLILSPDVSQRYIDFSKSALTEFALDGIAQLNKAIESAAKPATT